MQVFLIQQPNIDYVLLASVLHKEINYRSENKNIRTYTKAYVKILSELFRVEEFDVTKHLSFSFLITDHEITIEDALFISKTNIIFEYKFGRNMIVSGTLYDFFVGYEQIGDYVSEQTNKMFANIYLIIESFGFFDYYTKILLGDRIIIKRRS